ncbi:MAG: trypsin-like peptidase domain-containing protein [Planctomycetia bacterium]
MDFTKLPPRRRPTLLNRFGAPAGRRPSRGLGRATLAGFAAAALLGPAFALNPAHAGALSANRNTPRVQAVQRVLPSVVNIHSQKTVTTASNSATPYPNIGGPANRMNGMGTGVVIDERGYIVTNYHVIEDVTSIRATLHDGATYSAVVVARDPKIDVALIKIDPLNPLKIMPMGTSQDLLLAETVFAVGNAYGYEHTITEGIVSQLHRDVRLSEEQMYRDLIQTDASINPGNSGGPLINADGEMIGLNVAIRAGAQGIGFAIPVDEVQRVIAELMSTQRLNSVWHGMDVLGNSEGDAPSEGKVVVRRVASGSPAERAGILSQDAVLAIDGKPVEYAYDVERLLLSKQPGDEASVLVSRGGREELRRLKLQTTPVSVNSPIEVVFRRMGVRLSEQAPSAEVQQLAAQLRGGLRVDEVSPGSSAGKAGLTPGDVLIGLHQWETLTIENVLYVLNQQNLEQLGPMRFYVVRGGQIHRGFLELTQ